MEVFHSISMGLCVIILCYNKPQKTSQPVSYKAAPVKNTNRSAKHAVPFFHFILCLTEFAYLAATKTWNILNSAAEVTTYWTTSQVHLTQRWGAFSLPRWQRKKINQVSQNVMSSLINSTPWELRMHPIVLAPSPSSAKNSLLCLAWPQNIKINIS